MTIEHFFDAATWTLTYLVYDAETLARSLRLIEHPGSAVWTMPDVCRTLVSDLLERYLDLLYEV